MPVCIDRNSRRELWDWSEHATAVNEMEHDELEAMTTVVRASNVSVSYNTDSRQDGVTLSCFRTTSEEPTLDGNWREALYGDGYWFPNRTAAQRFCLIAGHIVEYRRLP